MAVDHSLRALPSSTGRERTDRDTSTAVDVTLIVGSLTSTILFYTTGPMGTTDIVDLAISTADLDVSLIEAVHGSCDVVTQGEQASGRC